MWVSTSQPHTLGRENESCPWWTTKGVSKRGLHIHPGSGGSAVPGVCGTTHVGKTRLRLEQVLLPFQGVPRSKGATDSTPSHKLCDSKCYTFVRGNASLHSVQVVHSGKAKLNYSSAEQKQHSHGRCHTHRAAWIFLGKEKQMWLCRGRI